MKTRENMKKDLLEFYKTRIKYIKDISSLQNSVDNYNYYISNYDELFDSLLKDLIDRKLGDIFYYIDNNMKAFDAIKLVDSGLDSIGIIDPDNALLSLFKSYKFNDGDVIKKSIVNMIYNHFGIIDNSKTLKYYK